MTLSSVPFNYTETFASATACGRKHSERFNEDRSGHFTVRLDTDETVHAFYVLDGHGELTRSKLVVSTGSRYVELVQSLLPTVLTELLNPALSSPVSDNGNDDDINNFVNNLTANLQRFHELVDEKAEELDQDLCEENGCTALVGFVLRNVLYVLCVGDSCALLMDGIGLPINIWKRCGVNEELGVCSWMDSLENYPNHKEGQTLKHIQQDYYKIKDNLFKPKGCKKFRLFSKHSKYTLSMINSLGNLFHKSYMLSRTNVYAIHLPTLFRLLPQTISGTSITLIFCTDGAKDELSAHNLALFMHDPYGALSFFTLEGAGLGLSLGAMVEAFRSKYGYEGYKVHEKGNKEGRRRMLEAVKEAKMCTHREVGEAEAERERVRKSIKCGCEAVVAASMLLGTNDDVTCLAVRITGVEDKAVDMCEGGKKEKKKASFKQDETFICITSAEHESEDTTTIPSPTETPTPTLEVSSQDEEMPEEEEHSYNLLDDEDLEQAEDDVEKGIIPGHEGDIDLSIAEDCIYEIDDDNTELLAIQDSCLDDSLLIEEYDIYDVDDDTPHTAKQGFPVSNVQNNLVGEKHILSSDHLLPSPVLDEIIVGQSVASNICAQPVRLPSPTPLLSSPIPLPDSFTPLPDSYAALEPDHVNVTSSVERDGKSRISDLNLPDNFSSSSSTFPPIVDGEESRLHHVESFLWTKQDSGEAVEPLTFPSPKDGQLHHAKWSSPTMQQNNCHKVATAPFSLSSSLFTACEAWQPNPKRVSIPDGKVREWSSSLVGLDEEIWLDESKEEWSAGNEHCSGEGMESKKRKLGDEV